MFLCQNLCQFKNDKDCGFVLESSDFRQSFNFTNAQQTLKFTMFTEFLAYASFTTHCMFLEH